MPVKRTHKEADRRWAQGENVTFGPLIQTKLVPSNVIPGAEAEVEVGFLCPRCDALNQIMAHSKSGQCPNCRLHMTLFGNILYIR